MNKTPSLTDGSFVAESAIWFLAEEAFALEVLVLREPLAVPPTVALRVLLSFHQTVPLR